MLVCPAYQQIGIAAPFLLAILRIVQGFALGGEVPGFITFVAESISEKWRELACSILTVGANLGVVAAGLVVTLLTYILDTKQMISLAGAFLS